MRKNGFTLIEIMIVVLIIGILTTMAVPMYRKTIETSKATDALAILNTIANANRMYALDNNNTYTTGPLNSSHPLVQRKYIADHPWGNYQWVFCSCNTTNCGGCGGGCGGSGRVACAYNNSQIGNPYNTWRYEIGANGSCFAYGIKVPPCPRI